MLNNRLDPLSGNTPIVDKSGAPTLEFQRKWAQQITANTTIPDLSQRKVIAGSGLKGGGNLGADITLSADVQAVLDQLGAGRGSLIYLGDSAWHLLAPGTADQVLTTGGAGADPSWADAAPTTPALTHNHVFVGSASNVAGDVAMSGDATIADTGVITVTKSGGVAFGSAALASTSAFDTAGAAAAALVTAEAYTDAHVPAGANPTAQVGAASVNGSAGTFMRSDAAPKLADTAVTPSTYGDTTHYAIVTVDQQGRITAASSQVVPAGVTAANPTATASNVAVNGSATTFMRSDAAPAIQKGLSTQFGVVQADGSSVVSTLGVLSVNAPAVTATTDADFDMQYFGNGADGNVTISSGTTSLGRDMYYNNLTLSGTGVLNTNGWRVFVFGTLDLTAAPANAIVHYNNAGAVLTGGNASTFAGGGGANGPNAQAIGGAAAGGNGGNGAISGTGAAGGGGSTTGHQIHSKAGVSGKGGTGGSASGGAAVTGNTSNFDIDIQRLTVELFMIVGTTVTQMQGGCSGPGGSAGGGDGSNHGGGAGGGGAGGGIVWLAARTISRGASTTAGAVNANGGAGGNGGQGATSGNVGGGGGGGGAGGGWLYVIYRFLAGASAANVLQAHGGNGGNGGNGFGTGAGGDGGGAGSRGRISTFNLATGAATLADSDTTVVAGTAASGTTGGAGASANTQQLTL